MLTPEKRARLATFLGSLPDATAARLFQAIETDRARGGRGLPHEERLSDLRRQLLEHDASFPARKPTAQRLFFTPFEDFFIGQRSGKKRRARIARSSLGPVWALLVNDPAAAGAARAAEALDKAIAGESQNRVVFEERLFAEAGEGFSRLREHARADEAYRSDLAERLGGLAALDDLIEIDALLPAAPHFKALQAAFPKPIATLTEEDLFELRRLYGRARGESAEAAPYLLLAFVGRMAAPWRAIAAYYHLAAARDDASADAAVIVEALFEELEGEARALAREAEGELDAEAAALRVAHFAEFAEGLAAEAKRVGDNVVRNRVEACRDVAGESLVRFTEQSLAAIRRAMPMRHAGGSSALRALRPDYQRPLTPQTSAAAREAAAFLAGAADFSSSLGRGEGAAAIVADATSEIRRYAGDLVAEIRAAEGEDRQAARRLMIEALAIAAALLPDGDVDLLRQRANAAALTA